MEAVRTGGHRCEYRTALDDLAFEILLDEDFSALADLLEPQELDLMRRFPRGETVYLTLTSIAFSSSESHTGEQIGEFEIRITWD